MGPRRGALIQLRWRGPGSGAGWTARLPAAGLIQLSAVAVRVITQAATLMGGGGGQETGKCDIDKGVIFGFCFKCNIIIETWQ